jgi:hypothetical protein|tara:strand:- start:8000 stop:8206 length:207 start_codon:yes stop_codon:yes gene_type:complete
MDLPKKTPSLQPIDFIKLLKSFIILDFLGHWFELTEFFRVKLETHLFFCMFFAAKRLLSTSPEFIGSG